MRPFFLPDTKFPEGSTIVQRIGLVLWWIGVAALFLSLIASAIAAVFDTNEAEFFLVAGFILGLISWLIGRAGLFLFSGR